MQEDEKSLPKVAGSLRGKQWGTIYTGAEVKCYKIKFTSFTGPLSDGSGPGIGIYVDGDQAKNQVGKLTAGQSTDVCGRKIQVYGFFHEAQAASWEASEIQEIDWFE